MSKNTDVIKEVVTEGIKHGQAETGVPVIVPPVTKEQRKEVAVKVVAKWYVRLWNYLMGR